MPHGQDPLTPEIRAERRRKIDSFKEIATQNQTTVKQLSDKLNTFRPQQEEMQKALEGQQQKYTQLLEKLQETFQALTNSESPSQEPEKSKLENLIQVFSEVKGADAELKAQTDNLEKVNQVVQKVTNTIDVLKQQEKGAQTELQEKGAQTELHKLNPQYPKNQQLPGSAHPGPTTQNKVEPNTGNTNKVELNKNAVKKETQSLEEKDKESNKKEVVTDSKQGANPDVESRTKRSQSVGNKPFNPLPVVPVDPAQAAKVAKVAQALQKAGMKPQEGNTNHTVPYKPGNVQGKGEGIG